MPDWENSPIVSFSRDGQAITLGRSGEEPTLHLKGSTGLGMAPVAIDKADRITSDGSVVRGIRRTDLELYIPLLVEQPSTGDLNLWRRELNRLLAPRTGDVEASYVDVQIEDPTTGSVRMIRGLYTDGLQGDYGDDTDGTWQALGLTFTCPDPWWLGTERVKEKQVNPGSKPFLSTTSNFFPVVLAESVVQDQWQIEVAGDADVWPTWQVTGPGTDLLIETDDARIFIAGDFAAGETTVIDTEAGRITPDRWANVSLDSRLFALKPGVNNVRISMVSATTATVVRLVWRERYLEGV